mmetsp:Transcript_12128/g.36818  ORF Transcript_12128/g.36818 Transcript_12128/m.36818 type:complete len:248 (+) Transcript_12128:241-984(+)
MMIKYSSHSFFRTGKKKASDSPKVPRGKLVQRDHPNQDTHQQEKPGRHHGRHGSLLGGGNEVEAAWDDESNDPGGDRTGDLQRGPDVWHLQRQHVADDEVGECDSPPRGGGLPLLPVLEQHGHFRLPQREVDQREGHAQDDGVHGPHRDGDDDASLVPNEGLQRVAAKVQQHVALDLVLEQDVAKGRDEEVEAHAPAPRCPHDLGHLVVMPWREVLLDVQQVVVAHQRREDHRKYANEGEDVLHQVA